MPFLPVLTGLSVTAIAAAWLAIDFERLRAKLRKRHRRGWIR